jgi:hypothetical protein
LAVHSQQKEKGWEGCWGNVLGRIEPRIKWMPFFKAKKARTNTSVEREERSEKKGDGEELWNLGLDAFKNLAPPPFPQT